MIVELAKQLQAGERPKTTQVGGYHVLGDLGQLVKKQCPETVFSKAHGVLRNESLPLEISRGCVFNCKFCHFDKKESIQKNVNALKEEILFVVLLEKFII